MIQRIIRYIRTRLARETHRQKAERGEYRYQFCPHCGTWIAHRYSPTRRWFGPALRGMEVTCPQCGVSFAVVTVAEPDEEPPGPLVEPRDAEIGEVTQL